MCGRFTQKLTWRQIHDLYNLTASVVLLNLQPRYNGAPEQEFAACKLDDDGNRTMVQLRWGLVPSWAQDVRIGTRLINARSETIHTKPLFGAAFRSRRCLVPANGWFEWQTTVQPMPSCPCGFSMISRSLAMVRAISFPSFFFTAYFWRL